MEQTLIKIDQPINENMEYDLTEEQADALYESVKESLNKECSMNKAIREADFSLLGPIAAGSAAVAVIIAAITKHIKNKYRIKVKKLIGQSKELNDLYDKINDILKHDKMARFKHRNDLVKHEEHYPVMKDKNNGTDYQLMVDFIPYNFEYFTARINNMMTYVNTYSQNNKADDLKKMTDTIILEADQQFVAKHGFIRTCEPVMKVVNHGQDKLDKVLNAYKTLIGNIYSVIFTINKYVEAEIQYVQGANINYNKMLALYGKDKDEKAAVDKIFKYILKNLTDSIDFNNKSIDLFTIQINYYVDQFTEIYDMLRS